MLNGKKSYLLSFTALFSKKGYELAFGIDTIFDTARDTKYHLTAPVYSTYRTLKLDTLKTANKVPHSATGLFGKNMTLASNVTEVEGVEMQTVYASIVSYLSDIYKHFNGELVLKGGRESTGLRKASRIDLFAESAGVEKAAVSIQEANQDFNVLADTILDAVQETMTESTTFLNATTEYTIRVELISDSFNTDVGEQISTKLKDVVETFIGTAVGGKLLKPIYDVEEVLLVEAFTKDPDVEIVSATASRSLDVITEFEIAEGTSRVRGETYDIYIEQLSPSTVDHDYDLAYIEILSETWKYDGARIEVVGLSEGVNSKVEDVEVVLFTDGQSSETMESQEPESMLTGLIENSVPVHTEFIEGSVVSMGEEVDVFDLVPSEMSTGGYDSILDVTHTGHSELHVDAEKDTTEIADLVKTVISNSPEISKTARLLEIMHGSRAFEMIEAGMSEIVDSFVQGTEHANVGAVTEAVIKQIERAMSGGTLESTAQETELGKVEYFGDTTVHDIGKAIWDANNKLVAMSSHEYGMIIANGEGVTHVIEKAETDNSAQVEMTDTETAELIGVSDGGVMINTALANNDHIVLDADDRTGATVGEVGVSMESVFEYPSLAGRDIVTKDATIHEIGSADSGANLDARLDGAEVAGLDMGVESVIEQMTNQEIGENVLDAIVDKSDHSGADNVYEAVNIGSEPAYIGDRNMVADIEEQVKGELGGGTYETVVDKDTEAGSILTTESTEVHEISEGSRKKKVIPTTVEGQGKSSKPKRVYETNIEKGSTADRTKRELQTTIEETAKGERVKKSIETAIEKGSKATNETVPVTPKRKIWIILGKIASWSIWNWKKTR